MGTTVNNAPPGAASGRRGLWLGIPPNVRLVIGGVLIGVAMFALPFAVREIEKETSLSLLFSLNVALLYVVLALGLNIVVGFAGLLDLGYAAFFALGAYTFGILTGPVHELGWSFWIAILFVPVVAALFGLIIGAPTLRLRGDYLAIVTLGFGEIVPNALRNMNDIHIPWRQLNHFNLTNGAQGLSPVGVP
jgi:branched-chain amino acid transport system permease protein